MPRDNDPFKLYDNVPDEKKPGLLSRRAVLTGGVALAALAIPSAAVAKFSWDDSVRRIKAERLQERTHEEDGQHEVIEIISLQNIQPVTGYKIEHTGTTVERQFEADVPGTNFNLLKGNSVSVTVNKIETESQVSLNLEKLSEVEVVYDPESKVATLTVSNEDLIVQSHEVRGARDVEPPVTKGAAAMGAGIIDRTILNGDDKKLIEDIAKDLETLAVNLNLRYADEKARDIVEDTRSAFEEEIAKEVKYALGEKHGVDISEIDVKVDWADTDKNPEIKDHDKHQKQIEELGGTVSEEGDHDKIGLPANGGQA